MLLCAAVLLAGLTLSLVAFVALRADQRENARQVMDQRTAVALAAVRTETDRYAELVATAAAGIATDASLTWEDFDAATAPLESADLAGAASLAYVVPDRTEQVRLHLGTDPRPLALVEEVGFVHDDEVGAEELVLEHLLHRIFVVERLIRRALCRQRVEVGGDLTFG